MTIDRQHGRQFISCDTCGEETERGSDCMHFEEWIEALKDEGWAFHKHNKNGVWEHECPSCASAVRSVTM